MHAGRVYPYHPHYWATTAWFWPGFVPWKMTLSVFDNSTPPWGVLPAGYGEVSQAGTVNASSEIVTYEFTHHAPAFGLILKLDRGHDITGDYARWTLDIVGGPLTWARAVQLQSIPQRRVFNLTWPYLFGGFPYPALGPPKYQFTPSLYSEGGSPWPNY